VMGGRYPAGWSVPSPVSHTNTEQAQPVVRTLFLLLRWRDSLVWLVGSPLALNIVTLAIYVCTHKRMEVLGRGTQLQYRDPSRPASLQTSHPAGTSSRCRSISVPVWCALHQVGPCMGSRCSARLSATSTAPISTRVRGPLVKHWYPRSRDGIAVTVVRGRRE
jgi:hypothetical protein